MCMCVSVAWVIRSVRQSLHDLCPLADPVLPKERSNCFYLPSSCQGVHLVGRCSRADRAAAGSISPCLPPAVWLTVWNI